MNAPGKPLTQVREIVIHHSKTPDLPGPLSADAIRRHHVYRNQWDDVGYHYLIERVQGVPVVIVGRPEDRTGAHCRGYNDHTIGICFVGDFDVTEPADDILEVAAERILVPLLDRHALGLANIIGDRDHHETKSCPGARFDLNRLRDVVARAIGRRVLA
jgi:N-acetylmuramoyl-L-alanine amidase